MVSNPSDYVVAAHALRKAYKPQLRNNKDILIGDSDTGF